MSQDPARRTEITRCFNKANSHLKLVPNRLEEKKRNKVKKRHTYVCSTVTDPESQEQVRHEHRRKEKSEFWCRVLIEAGTSERHLYLECRNIKKLLRLTLRN